MNTKSLLTLISFCAITVLVPAELAFAADTDSPCPGETWRIVDHVQSSRKSKESPAGNYDPNGFETEDYIDYSIRATYVEDHTQEKARWLSRTFEWSGSAYTEVTGCYGFSCSTGGGLQLGPSETLSSASNASQLQWSCRHWLEGNCFGYLHALPLPFSLPDIVPKSQLDADHCYSKETNNERYSVCLTPAAPEQLTLEAHPSEVDANETAPNDVTTKLSLYVSCHGVPVANEPVDLRVSAEDRSGGHNHLTNRPRGKLKGNDCGVDQPGPGLGPGNLDFGGPCLTVKTDHDGHATIKYSAPLTGSCSSATYGGDCTSTHGYKSGVAGLYDITAESHRLPVAKASVVVHAYAKKQSLQPMPRSDKDYTLDRPGEGPGGLHPQGLWATPGTARAFADLARVFRNYQETHNSALVACGQIAWPVALLSFNDIALPEGGILDLNGDWVPGHQTHNKGEGGDLNRFGAGAGMSSAKGTECDGSKYNLQNWYAHLLLDLGSPPAGHWDCTDLQMTNSTPNAWNSAARCAAGEFPVYTPSGAAWFPHRLHLHIED